MKKICSLILLLLSLNNAFGQSGINIQHPGNATQLTQYQGGIGADKFMRLPNACYVFPVDSCGRIWYDSANKTGIYFNDCNNAYQILSKKDTGWLRTFVMLEGFVNSFNGRTGYITPATGDYSYGQITGAQGQIDTLTYDATKTDLVNALVFGNEAYNRLLKNNTDIGFNYSISGQQTIIYDNNANIHEGALLCVGVDSFIYVGPHDTSKCEVSIYGDLTTSNKLGRNNSWTAPTQFYDNPYTDDLNVAGFFEKNYGQHGIGIIWWREYDPINITDTIMMTYTLDKGNTWSSPTQVIGLGTGGSNLDLAPFSHPIRDKYGNYYMSFYNSGTCYFLTANINNLTSWSIGQHVYGAGTSITNMIYANEPTFAIIGDTVVGNMRYDSANSSSAAQRNYQIVGTVDNGGGHITFHYVGITNMGIQSLTNGFKCVATNDLADTTRRKFLSIQSVRNTGNVTNGCGYAKDHTEIYEASPAAIWTNAQGWTYLKTIDRNKPNQSTNGAGEPIISYPSLTFGYNSDSTIFGITTDGYYSTAIPRGGTGMLNPQQGSISSFSINYNAVKSTANTFVSGFWYHDALRNSDELVDIYRAYVYDPHFSNDTGALFMNVPENTKMFYVFAANQQNGQIPYVSPNGTTMIPTNITNGVLQLINNGTYSYYAPTVDLLAMHSLQATATGAYILIGNDSIVYSSGAMQIYNRTSTSNAGVTIMGSSGGTSGKLSIYPTNVLSNPWLQITPSLITFGTSNNHQASVTIQDTTASWFLLNLGNGLFEQFFGNFLVANGNITAQGSSGGLISALHFKGGSSAPTIVAGTGAGTSPTISISGNDVDGKITLTTGTTPAASSIVATITFNAAYVATPIPSNPAAGNGNSASLSGNGQVWYTTSTSALTLNVGSSALAATTTYIWYYHVLQ